MTLQARISFDPNLPLVVSSPEVTIGGVRIGQGEVLDWKKLGVTVENAFEMWRAGILTHLPAETPQPASDATDASSEHSASEHAKAEKHEHRTPRKR